MRRSLGVISLSRRAFTDTARSANQWCRSHNIPRNWLSVEPHDNITRHVQRLFGGISNDITKSAERNERHSSNQWQNFCGLYHDHWMSRMSRMRRTNQFHSGISTGFISFHPILACLLHPIHPYGTFDIFRFLNCCNEWKYLFSDHFPEQLRRKPRSDPTRGRSKNDSHFALTMCTR
jgi:hypothetical protein